MKKERLVFASVVYPTTFSQKAALVLAESVRAFAGSLADVPIWFFMPEYGKILNSEITQKLQKLNVELISFEVSPEIVQFPLAADVQAAVHAEVKAVGEEAMLAWLGSNTIVLKEPSDFILDAKITLGFRPVHHALIGSRYEEPLDLFWTRIYDYCEVSDELIFPMTGHTDGVKIRPYFNAGFLIIRPEKKVLQTWQKTFLGIYQKPDFQEFYTKDGRYAIFMHQAVLSGVILSSLKREEMEELPSGHNYPLHLYEEDVTEGRPGSIDELITVRHEGLENPAWMNTMQMKDTVRAWLEERTSSDYV